MSVNKSKGMMSIQMGIAIAVAVLLAVAFFATRHFYGENQKLKKENTQQEVTIGSQKKAIELDQKSDAITDKVSMQVALETGKITKKHEQIAQDTQEKVDKINEDHKVQQDAAPTEAQKAEIETARINAVSAARIDGLWSAYCQAAPTAEECKPQPVRSKT